MSGGYQLIEVANGNSAGVSAGAGTTITAGSATYGAYVPLIASTPFDTSFVQVDFNMITASNNNNNTLTIAVGASGSEVPVVSDYWVSYDTPQTLSFLRSIPAGSKISARLWGDFGPDTAMVSVSLFDSALSCPEGYAGVEAVTGVSPNITGNLTSGASGAYSSWTQVLASTRRDYAGLIPTVSTNAGGNIIGMMYEIGVGAAGSEVPILVDKQAYALSTRDAWVGQFLPIPIPAGTRLSFRTTTSSGSPVITRISLMGVV